MLASIHYNKQNERFNAIYSRKSTEYVIIADECGIRHYPSGTPERSNRHKRIPGSVTAVAGEFPWQVRLRSFGQVTYSGVSIGYNWVLTAASCFDGNYHPSLWNAVLGDYDTANQDSTERTIFVESIFIYEGFTGGDSADNIALVKLRLDQVAALDVRSDTDACRPQFDPVCMPNGSEDLTSSCYLTGWGATKTGQESSSALRKLQLSLVNSTDCKELYGPRVEQKYLCTTNTDDGPCTGDRGSPVLCQTADRWSVVGIVSGEYACLPNATAPGKFVDVARYSQWINKIMAKF